MAIYYFKVTYKKPWHMNTIQKEQAVPADTEDRQEWAETDKLPTTD
jgi:hypothetical protein